MRDADNPPSRGREALSKGVDLLARRPHFAGELRAKLARRGFEEPDVAAALERLKELGYLDDREAAQSWIAAAVEGKAWGPRRVRAELLRRGVDEALVDELTPAAYPDGERPVADRAARRWRGRDPAALGRHLERRGFSSSVIIEIVERFGRSGPEGSRAP